MNKYQEALDRFWEAQDEYHCLGYSRSLLQELVEKATPKLPKRNFGKGVNYKCPVCESSIGTKNKYCKHCGQRIKWEKINWSEDDE